MSGCNFRIAVIRGDGIGVEVVEEGLNVLRAVDDRAALGLEFTEFPWGSEYYLKYGAMMPVDALASPGRLRVPNQTETTVMMPMAMASGRNGKP